MSSIGTTSIATRSTFYIWMAAVFTAVAFGGFFPVYWLKLANGTFVGNPVMHIHGTLFFAWTMLLLVQTYLVANGRTMHHRAIGVFGVSLMTAMIITIILAAINSYKVAEPDGFGDAARQFSIVSLLGAVAMAGMFATAIANTAKPETHKRLMISLCAIMMSAPLGRVFMVLFAPPDAKGPPPVEVIIGPAIVILFYFAAGLIYDFRTRGRPHPAYYIGITVHIVYTVICIMFARTEFWMSIARGVESLAG